MAGGRHMRGGAVFREDMTGVRAGAMQGLTGGVRGGMLVPELPEVETIVRDLRRQRLVGRRIAGVTLHWAGVIGGQDPCLFERAVRRRGIQGIARRAKYIIFRLDGGVSILIHLRMTGRFQIEKPPVSRHACARAEIRLDDGRVLMFIDPRKFGRWVLTDDLESALAGLGPEPLSGDFTADGFAARIRRFRRQIKPLLLDQSFVAGIGNIYADEALWGARIHPCRLSSDLTPADVKRLYRSIRTVLSQGIRNRGTSLGRGKPNFKSAGGRHGSNQSYLKVFRRAGMPCPRCGTTLRRMVVGQRGTHVCPLCQVRPSSLPCVSR